MVSNIKYRLNFLTLIIVVFTYGQENDHYRLYKGGKEYPKIVRYIMVDEFSKTISVTRNENKITFYCESQEFVFDREKHCFSAMTEKELSDVNVVTMPELMEDEFKEYKRVWKLEGRKYPSTTHANVKVYVLLKEDVKNYACYEVNWIASIR